MTLPLRDGCAADCPACRHRQWTHEASLAQKQQFLADKLAPWAAVLAPLRSVPEALRWGYRARVKLAAHWHFYHWEFGLEPRDSFIAIPRCPVQAEVVNRTLAVLAKVMPEPEQWPLRYIVQNGALVTLVLKINRLPDTSFFTPEVLAELAACGVAGLHVNLHPATGRILFSKNWHCVWGESRVKDALGLWHGPGAFQQLLPSLYEESLTLAEEFLAPAPGMVFADMYCGIGASMQRWSRKGAQVVGVELDAEAIVCAGLNAPDAAALRGLCAQRLPQVRSLTAEFTERRAYVNPPRLGLEPEVLAWLAQDYRPQRVAYLSCSAGTLRRDLLALVEAGYEVTALVPFDFFPQTHHVEVLALLARKA